MVPIPFKTDLEQHVKLLHFTGRGNKIAPLAVTLVALARLLEYDGHWWQ